MNASLPAVRSIRVTRSQCLDVDLEAVAVTFGEKWFASALAWAERPKAATKFMADAVPAAGFRRKRELAWWAGDGSRVCFRTVDVDAP